MRPLATKIVDRMGRIVIPATLREQLGIYEGTPLSLSRGEKANEIILTVLSDIRGTEGGYTSFEEGDNFMSELLK